MLFFISVRKNSALISQVRTKVPKTEGRAKQTKDFSSAKEQERCVTTGVGTSLVNSIVRNKDHEQTASKSPF